MRPEPVGLEPQHLHDDGVYARTVSKEGTECIVISKAVIGSNL